MQFEWGWPEMDKVARRVDIVERIGDGLAALDPDGRAAFVLQIVEGIPDDDVAAILEVPICTVRRRTRFACLLMGAYLFRLSACIGDTKTTQPARGVLSSNEPDSEEPIPQSASSSPSSSSGNR